MRSEPGLRFRPRRSRAACLASLVLPALLAAGCGNSVREDRTIQSSKDGKSIAFQHGEEGVFVASRGKLIKVFQPNENTVATSTPLWAPDGKRIIFATAERLNDPADGESTRVASGGSWDDNPAGRTFFEEPVRYICWMRDMDGDDDAKPRRLFEAKCNHVGYVAASLALRWNADGSRIFFLDKGAPEKHRLCTFDVEQKTVDSAFPHEARDVVFDFHRKSGRMVCLLAIDNDEEHFNTEIWVGAPGRDDWRRLPGTSQNSFRSGTIKTLRTMLPVWTRDGKRFAWCAATGDKPREYVVRSADHAGRRASPLCTLNHPARDLHWSPDGRRLGFLSGEPSTELHFVGVDGVGEDSVGEDRVGEDRVGEEATVETLHTPRPVRRFAGWDSTGEFLAYTTTWSAPAAGDLSRAFLLIPAARSRDAVWVAPGDGLSAGRTLFTDMRATFPNWSPTEPKLSLWATFTPTYRYLGNAIRPGGMRPGDPAMELDARTGSIRWFAVNPTETIQIGHYHLLKGDAAEAERRYESASISHQNAPPAKHNHSDRAAETALFRSICLKRLGRDADADIQLAAFRKSFQLANDRRADSAENRRSPSRKLTTALARNFLAIEVFLSLSAVKECRQFLDAELQAAASDEDRFGAAIALSQCQLLTGRNEEYRKCLTEFVLPLFVKLWTPEFDPTEDSFNETQMELAFAVAATLVPLSDADCPLVVGNQRLAETLQNVREQRGLADAEFPRLWLEILANGLALRLGNADQAGESRRRIDQIRKRLPTSVGELPTTMLEFAELRALFQIVDVASR